MPVTVDPSALKVTQDKDLATHSNYTAIATQHIHLDWTIDWDAKVFHGQAVLTLEGISDEDTVILDVSYLDIDKVIIGGQEVKWTVGERRGNAGSPLTIALPETLNPGKNVDVTIKYSTTKDCTAVGWLTPEQTKSGKYPYFFSQSQAIHGRSLFPCQDTPAVKATYSAHVKSILPVLMSGLRKSPSPEEPIQLGKEVEYVYDQPVAIASYLIAIASGELVYRAFEKLPGKKWSTGVWTEPLMMNKVFWEFKDDTANFVAKAEEIAGYAYDFGVYDLLVLPESFPYGGMENACLTFVTPTLVAGDRSEVTTVAHEASHSWFGNGIGCASWSHFWLNEGWTTYCERLLLRATLGEAARQLSFTVGRRALQEDLKMFKDTPRFQSLVTKYNAFEDPDDAFSRIPYEKGSNFLLYLEGVVGGLDHFLPYMKDYVNTFKASSITTEQWRSHLFEFFGKQSDSKEYLKRIGQVDWDEWLHGHGPDLCVDVQYDDSLSKPCAELARRWDQSREQSEPKGFSADDTKSFSATQMVVFLERLEATAALPPTRVAALEKLYGFDTNENANTMLCFYQIALKSGPEYAQRAADWVTNKGRMKYCRPVFRLLYKQTPELAVKTFRAHENFYHPIARKMIAQDLGLALTKA